MKKCTKNEGEHFSPESCISLLDRENAGQEGGIV